MPGLFVHGLEHARLGHADPGDEQQKAEHAADDEGVPPVIGIGDDVREDGAGDAHRGDEHGAVAPDARVQDLGHEGDPRPELAGQADAGDEAQGCVGLKRRDHAVRDVRDGVQEDRAEHDLEPALPVAQNAPDNPADQHARHLHVQKKHAVVDQLLPGKPERLEARHPDDAEEHQVVDVDEIAESSDDDRQAENTAKGTASALFHEALLCIRKEFRDD